MRLDNEADKGYATVLKSTGIFGGTQLIVIVISILKSKIIALWLGTVGLGIMSLFGAVTGLIFSITNLGLQSSAVRDIAQAQAKNNITLVSNIVKAINRWVFSTGLAGALITIVLSPLLSQWLFDSNKYIVSFIMLSSVVFLSSIYNGHYAILQGTRQLKLMAKANVFGALAGFVFSVPIFYFWGKNGIVCAMILTALSTTIVSWLYARKTNLVRVSQTLKQSYFLGLNTAKLGIAMAIAAITVLLVEFVVKTFISHHGGIEGVGLYQAGWALNASYLGMVFGAMGKDYFPRLSQCADDNKTLEKRMNQQSEISVLILAPLIICMIIFMPLLIKLFYSVDFLSIISMTSWLMIGSFIKAGSWGISFIFLAKSDVKLFLFNELGINCITLPSYLLGYYFYDLAGVGYAYTFNYIIYFLWVGIIAYKKYQIRYNNKFWKLFVLLLFVLLIFPIGKLFFNVNNTIGIILIIIVGFYSLYELNKRLYLIEILKKFWKK